jgi:hypothetical protein
MVAPALSHGPLTPETGGPFEAPTGKRPERRSGRGVTIVVGISVVAVAVVVLKGRGPTPEPPSREPAARVAAQGSGATSPMEAVPTVAPRLGATAAPSASSEPPLPSAVPVARPTPTRPAAAPAKKPITPAGKRGLAEDNPF